MIARSPVVLASLLVLSVVWPTGTFSQDAVIGSGKEVQVIDGDTIEIRGRIIDFYGIDAPELGQVCIHNGTPWQCGLEAAFILHKMLTIEHEPVVCRPWPRIEGATTAICEAGNLDIVHSLISSGYTIVLPDAFPDYVDRESSAKRVGVGLWRGAFVPPPSWRSGKRLPEEESMRSDLAACPVKATLDAAGRKIYRVPTDRDFRRTGVAPGRGERCFLSDEAARANGWKRRSEYAESRPKPQ